MYSKRQRAYLSTLCNCSRYEREQLLKCIPSDISNILSEIVKNLFAGNIKLRSKNFRRLRRYRTALERINANRIKKKRQVLIQQQGGGFIPLLIPLITSVVGSLLI